MADAAVFNAVIRAVDQASGPFRAIGAHARGMAGVMRAAFGETAAGAHHAGTELHKTGDAAKRAGHEIEKAAHPHGYGVLAGHISLLRSHFGALNLGIGEVGHSLTEFLPALGALGAAGGLVGLFELTDRAAEGFSQLAKMATASGVTAQQFTELGFAAKATDVPVESMNTALFRLNRGIADAASGKNKDLAGLFAHLHISVRDATGHLRNAADLLPQLADAFTHTADPAMRARMAMALFGRQGMELLPLLMQGREELEKLAATADAVSFVPRGDDAENLEAYHRSMITFTAAIQGAVTEIGTKLAPVLKPIVDLATKWVVANRDWIATKLADQVKRLAEWLRELRLREIVEGMQQMIRHAAELADHVGGLTTIVGALAFVLASPMINAVLGIGGAILRFTGLLRALSLLAWANPILLGIGAVAAAAFLIYDNWGAVKQFFEDLWQGVSSAFQSAWDVIRPIIDLVQKGAAAITALPHALGIANAPGTPPSETPLNPFAPNYRSPILGAPADFPRLYHPGGAAAPAPLAAPAQGRVQVDVNVRGLPPDSTVRTRSSGIADPPDVDVGLSQAGLVGAW